MSEHLQIGAPQTKGLDLQAELDSLTPDLDFKVGLALLRNDSGRNEALSAEEISKALGSPKTAQEDISILRQIQTHLPALAVLSDSTDSLNIKGWENLTSIRQIIHEDDVLAARAKKFGMDNFALIDTDADGRLDDSELQDQVDCSTGNERILAKHLLDNNSTIANVVADGSLYDQWISSSSMTRSDLDALATGVISDARIAESYQATFGRERLQDGAQVGAFLIGKAGLAYFGRVGLVAGFVSGAITGAVSGSIIGKLEGNYFAERDTPSVRAFLKSIAA